jgi:hypothetical protein
MHRKEGILRRKSVLPTLLQVDLLPHIRIGNRRERSMTSVGEGICRLLVVAVGANRQSCDPSVTLLFKLVLEVVLGAADCLHGRCWPRAFRS